MAGGLTRFVYRASQILALLLLVVLLAELPVAAQHSSVQTGARKNRTKEGSGGSGKPKLVVIVVVDQMRGDYVDKFQQQWPGGLKRLVDEGAWFPGAASRHGS